MADEIEACAVISYPQLHYVSMRRIIMCNRMYEKIVNELDETEDTVWLDLKTNQTHKYCI